MDDVKPVNLKATLHIGKHKILLLEYPFSIVCFRAYFDIHFPLSIFYDEKRCTCIVSVIKFVSCIKSGFEIKCKLLFHCLLVWSMWVLYPTKRLHRHLYYSCLKEGSWGTPGKDSFMQNLSEFFIIYFYYKEYEN